MDSQARWFASAAALVVALLAEIMEYRRHRRRSLDVAGWVPWRGIQVAAVFAALAWALLALRV